MAEGLLRSNKTRDGIAAILADNLGYMEEDIWERQQQWAAEQQKFRDMEAALEQGGLRVLAKPNLLKQNWWTNSSVGHNVVYGNDSRIGGTSYPYLKSYNEPTLHELQSPPTAAQLAEACAYYTYTEDGVTHYNLYKDEDDIRATVVDLAAADQISEMDGEVYTKAINFAITANSAYGNSEWLCYCNPSTTQKYTAGTTPKAYGQIEELIPGEIYTMSFWARVLSGEGAWMRCAWGGRYGQIYESEGYCHLSDWIEIKGAIWQRYTWRFKYDPTGDWYSETSAVEDGVTKITRIYNWLKRVAFGIARKFDAVVQVCGFRLVKGRLWISETYDGLEDGINANVGAIENLKDADGDIMANLAETEEVTAKVNHAAGEVFVIGNQMYRATVAIAAGETIEVGTNCEKKTAEDFFASKEYVEDAAVNTIMVNLGTVDLGNGAVRFYPPFAAKKYRPVELILSNTSGISAVRVETGRRNKDYISLNATIKMTPGIMYNYSKDVTIKLEKLEKTFTYGADWTEEEINGAKVDFTY